MPLNRPVVPWKLNSVIGFDIQIGLLFTNSKCSMQSIIARRLYLERNNSQQLFSGLIRPSIMSRLMQMNFAENIIPKENHLCIQLEFHIIFSAKVHPLNNLIRYFGRESLSLTHKLSFFLLFSYACPLALCVCVSPLSRKYNFNLLALLVSIISIHWHKMMLFACSKLPSNVNGYFTCVICTFCVYVCCVCRDACVRSKNWNH